MRASETRADHMRRVIVVDASRMGRDLASGIIERLRPEWSVTTARDAASLFRASAERAPDIVLVDTTDPASPGLDLARDLRRRFPCAVIGLIRSGLRHSATSADEEGFPRVLKPLTVDGMRRFVAVLPAPAPDPRLFVAQPDRGGATAPDVA